MILSICIVTMNRAEKLIRALNSCIRCNLPADSEWEILIVDNASIDNTMNAVNVFFSDKNIRHTYVKLNENKGVGGGRNVVFNRAIGKYVYMLDDDAVIDYEKCPDFFIEAIKIMEKNEKIASLTTQIYDEAQKKDRLEDYHLPLGDNLYRCMMFCGGSHFLRKSFFVQSPYLDNMYGMEELPPSLKAFGDGMENVFAKDLRVIHQPEENKWTKDSDYYNDIALKYCVLNYEIKKRMYPWILRPLCFIAYEMRKRKHIGTRVNKQKVQNLRINRKGCELQLNYTLSLKRMIKLYECFGMSVF